MKYYIAIKMQFIGEIMRVSGPYDSFKEAEADFDIQKLIWDDNTDEDQYLGIVEVDE